MESPWGDEVIAGEYGGHPGLVFAHRPRTFAEFLTGVQRWSRRTFLVQGERRITGGQFFAAVRAAREMLAPFGIRPTLGTLMDTLVPSRPVALRPTTSRLPWEIA